jgi:hypothetical protein
MYIQCLAATWYSKDGCNIPGVAQGLAGDELGTAVGVGQQVQPRVPDAVAVGVQLGDYRSSACDRTSRPLIILYTTRNASKC